MTEQTLIEQLSTDLKLCRVCKETKSRDSFWKDKKFKDGLKPRCKICAKAYTDQYRFGELGNREKIVQRDGEKCVKCGMSRQEHKERFSGDITVDHINADRSNNDPSNLQTLCLICHEEKDRARRHPPFGSQCKHAKLVESQVIKIREMYKTGEYTYKSLGEVFGVSDDTIYRIYRRKIWNHV